MKYSRIKSNAGFSLIELLITMGVMLMAMAIVSSVMYRAFGVQARESRTTDAMTSAQAALSVISREVSNAGFGMYEGPDSKIAHNGIVIADSGTNRIRVRANLNNYGGTPLASDPSSAVIDPSEDVTYFFDAATKSIVRHDPNGGGTGTAETSVVVNRISNVTFEYYDYAGGTSAATGPLTTPTVDTGRVRIIVEVELDPVSGQPDNQRITFSSDVTLRNNSYMLQQY